MTNEMSPLKQLMDAHPALFRGEPPRILSYLHRGWYRIMDELCTDLERMLGPRAADFAWDQIKEKFGGLRAYWGLGETVPLQADVIEAKAKRAHQHVPDWQVEVAKTPPVGFALTLLPHDELQAAVYARVKEAEMESERSCCECGATGELWSDGWLHTACDAHHRPGAVKVAAMDSANRGLGSDV